MIPGGIILLVFFNKFSVKMKSIIKFIDILEDKKKGKISLLV